MPALVSLIIPCYNVERYVDMCVRSAQEQSLKDIEIICINDGSTDNTLAILQDLSSKDERIRIIDKPNTGYGNTMNCGLDAATGKYVAFLESDDFIDPDMLEVHYNIAEKHKLDVVKSNFYLHWSEPRPKDIHCDLLDEEECGRVVSPRKEEHIFYIKPSIWSALYKMSFIREHNIRFNETPGASFQDASFNFQVWLCAERVWFIREAYLHYRQDNESSSVKSPDKAYCVCEEYKRMADLIDALEDKDYAAHMRSVLVVMKYDTYMWNYERLSGQLAQEFLDRFEEEMRQHIERGELDWKAFRPDKRYELKLFLTDRDFMLLRHSAYRKKMGSLRRMLTYFRAGGIDYVRKPFHSDELEEDICQ